MNSGVLIAGVGNIFRGDDAFGVEVVRRLQSRNLPPEVCVRDFGIRGYDLAFTIAEPWQLVVLVDAVERGEHPGTVFVIEPEFDNAPVEQNETFESHAMTPAAVFRLVKLLGANPSPTVIIGCQPAELGGDDGCMGLSEVVNAAVEPAISVIEQILVERMGSPMTARAS